MNISQIFVERPIATSLLMAAILLFGLVAYQSLPVSDLPNIDFPTLLITATLPGANPETMASAVATPLENQFSTIAGLNSMTSVNSLGATLITLEFDLSRSLDGAAVDVQAAITQASRLLPPNMPTPPTFTKVNPADQPVLYIALTSASLPLWTLDEYAQTRVAQRISMVSGVAQVQVLGSQKYAVHVQMDPHAMAARQVGIIRALVGAGANLDAVNRQNLTPLLLAEKPEPPPPPGNNTDSRAWKPKQDSRVDVIATLRELMHLGPNDPAPVPPALPVPPKPDSTPEDPQ